MTILSFHVRARWVLPGWWLEFNSPGWCYAVLVVVCVIHPPLQRAPLRKLVQRGAMHAYMLCVCTVYLLPWHMSGRPPQPGGMKIVVRVTVDAIWYIIIHPQQCQILFPTVFNYCK